MRIKNSFLEEVALTLDLSKEKVFWKVEMEWRQGKHSTNGSPEIDKQFLSLG